MYASGFGSKVGSRSAPNVTLPIRHFCALNQWFNAMGRRGHVLMLIHTWRFPCQAQSSITTRYGNGCGRIICSAGRLGAQRQRPLGLHRRLLARRPQPCVTGAARAAAMPRAVLTTGILAGSAQLYQRRPLAAQVRAHSPRCVRAEDAPQGGTKLLVRYPRNK